MGKLKRVECEDEKAVEFVVFSAFSKIINNLIKVVKMANFVPSIKLIITIFIY